MSNPVVKATARLASAYASKDPERIAEARRELSEAKLLRAIHEALSTSPDLAAEFRESIARLLTNEDALDNMAREVVTEAHRRGLTVLSVPCPVCRAGVGKPCVSVREGVRENSHLARQRKFEERKNGGAS